MLKYAMQTGKMNEIMELLFRVLDLRITFFDLQECEVDNFNIKKMSPFCRRHRQDEAFDALCVKCDREHLSIAKQTGRPCIFIIVTPVYWKVLFLSITAKDSISEPLFSDSFATGRKNIRVRIKRRKGY